AAREVVGGELHPHAVAGQDPDAVAPHLARRVPEGLVTVVELDPEHAAPECLDHLTLELDLLFLVGYLPTPFDQDAVRPWWGARQSVPRTPSRRSRSRRSPRGPSGPRGARTRPWIPRRGTCSPRRRSARSGRTGPCRPRRA